MFLKLILVVCFQLLPLINAQSKKPTVSPSMSPTYSPTNIPSRLPTFSPLVGSTIDLSTAGLYSFTIPTGVQYLVVDLYGAQGQDVPKTSAQSFGGKGAQVRMTVTKFRPSQTMYVTVGSRGGTFGNPGTAGADSGTGLCGQGAGAGGGYSALFDSGNYIIGLAGGGGGGGDG